MNKFTIRISSNAEDDIQNTIDYYNDQQQGLGKKFHSYIIKAFEILKINPFFKIYRKNIRCMVLLRYPFSIFYTVNEDTKIVYVYGILHQSLNPSKITKRIKKD